MNVGELIERVRLEIHNDLTDTQIVGRFNELSKRLFRKFTLPEKIFRFITSEIPYYNLPLDCAEDRIRNVTIDGTKYTLVSPSFQLPPYYHCYMVDEALYINPSPENREGFIRYLPRPFELSENDQVPLLPKDYHSLYIYDACQWIAGIQRDVDMKNNFVSDFESLLRDAERDLRKSGLKRVQETTDWSC